MVLRRAVLIQLIVTLLLLSWGVGLPFALGYLNYDADQSIWIWNVYLWQGPLVALAWILIPARRWLGAVVGDPARSADRAGLYRQVHRLPVALSCLLAGGMVSSQLVFSVLLYAVPRFPYDECIKNVIFSLALALTAATISYFMVSQLLSPMLELCATVAGEEAARPTVSLFAKASLCLFVLGLVTTTVMGLVAYTSNQRLLEDNLGERVLRRLELMAREIESGDKWTGMLQFQGLEQVGIIDAAGRLSYYRGPDGVNRGLAADLTNLGDRSVSGWAVCHQTSTRVFGWYHLGGGSTLVASVPLSDYSGQLKEALKGTLVVGTFTAVLAAALSWFLAGNFLRPLSVLTRVASRVPRNWPETMEAWYTDDEIGVLGRNFKSMLQELRLAQQELERSNIQLSSLVEERTDRMRQLSTLYTVAKSVTSKIKLDRVLDELLKHVQDLLEADACCISLADRDYLIPRAVEGLRELPPATRLTEGIAGRAAEGGLPVVVEFPDPSAVSQDRPLGVPTPFDPEDSLVRTAREAGMQSLVCAPMVVRDGVIGMVTVYYRELEDASQSDTELLATLTRQAAVSVVNAQLFDERDRVSELLRRVLIPEPELGFAGVGVGHRYIPSKMLSGDYYDLIPLGPHRFGVVMADVAGKGPEAAVVTVQVKHVIHSHALSGCSPCDVLAYLNRQLNGQRMVTVFYAVVDLERRELRYCMAGHEPALFKPPGGATRMLEGDGLVVGAVLDTAYQEFVEPLSEGSLMLFYTDGLTEARAPDGRFLGLEPAMAIMDEAGEDTPPQQLVDQIYEEAVRFCQGRLGDDLSLLAIRF